MAPPFDDLDDETADENASLLMVGLVMAIILVVAVVADLRRSVVRWMRGRPR